jgi:hypothetical protein
MTQILLVAQDRRPAGIVVLEEQSAKVRLAPAFESARSGLETLLAKAFAEGVETRMQERTQDQLRTVKTVVRTGDQSFAMAVRDAINAARLGESRLFAFIRSVGPAVEGGAK